MTTTPKVSQRTREVWDKFQPILSEKVKELNFEYCAAPYPRYLGVIEDLAKDGIIPDYVVFIVVDNMNGVKRPEDNSDTTIPPGQSDP